MQWPSIVALSVSAVALLFTAWAAWATDRQARAAAAQTKIQMEQVAAAREQTALQQQLAREALQPYVWVDIQPDAQQGTALNVVMGNSGPTVARNIRVTFDPPLQGCEPVSEISKVQHMLTNGLRSLAPGRVLRWTLGAAHEVLASGAPLAHNVRVEADGPYGPAPVLEFDIDMAQWGETRDAPDGSLHHVRGAIDKLGEAVTAVDVTLRRALPGDR